MNHSYHWICLVQRRDGVHRVLSLIGMVKVKSLNRFSMIEHLYIQTRNLQRNPNVLITHLLEKLLDTKLDFWRRHHYDLDPELEKDWELSLQSLKFGKY